MLRTNLSTRPFYNERAVHFVLVILGFVAVAVMAIGAYRLVDLARANTSMTAAAARDEAEAAEVATQAAAIRRGINDDELEALAAAAQEANRLIDRRVFSWTEFFNRIERTLPANVMLTSVRPDIEADLVDVSMGVIGREVEHIDNFIEQLEATGAFAEVLAREEEITEQGMYRALLRGRYLPINGAGEDGGGAAAPTAADVPPPPAAPTQTPVTAPDAPPPATPR